MWIKKDVILETLPQTHQNLFIATHKGYKGRKKKKKSSDLVLSFYSFINSDSFVLRSPWFVHPQLRGGSRDTNKQKQTARQKQGGGLMNTEKEAEIDCWTDKHSDKNREADR